MTKQGRWVFRGQEHAEWDLTTSSERIVGIADQWLGDERIFEQFKSAASDFLLDGGKIPTADLEWLSLMQHHGAPTRLIDWTLSPYVALYFALENAKDKINCALYAIDFEKLRGDCLSELESLEICPKGIPLTDSCFSKCFDNILTSVIPKGIVVPLVPEYGNKRLFVQQGLFLYPAQKNRTFEENLLCVKLRKGLVMKKFVLGSDIRCEALKDLEHMNVTRASLFPDLDGFAKALHLKFSVEYEMRKNERPLV